MKMPWRTTSARGSFTVTAPPVRSPTRTTGNQEPDRAPLVGRKGTRLRSSGNQAPHRAREIAESFGADAERYDRARPRYPSAVVELVLGLSPGREVLDVGIGTGIAADQFRAKGCRVFGVDVDP